MAESRLNAEETLELRKKALLATGWMQGKGGWWYGPTGERVREEEEDLLPAIESDPAVFWPWFLALCRERGWHFKFDGGSVVIPDDCRLYRADSGNPIASGEGANPWMAGVRAVIAASDKEKP